MSGSGRSEGTTTLRNVAKHSKGDTVSHPRGHESSLTRWINTDTCNCDFSEIETLVEQDIDVPVDNLSTLARIQRIQHMMLVWMFARAVSDYNEVLLKHQEKCRAIVRQQMMISKFSGSQNRVLRGILLCKMYNRRMRQEDNKELHGLLSEQNGMFTQI